MDFKKVMNGEGNSILHNEADIKKLYVSVSGSGNEILIERLSKINNLSISIHGNNNKITISERCSIVGSFVIKGDGNSLFIDKLTSFQNTNINIQEGTSVTIGENCMFASGVSIRTTDSHSITDMEGNRLNHAKNIIIGDKCWLGLDALIMKGSVIPRETIAGARSTVSGVFTEENTIIAGTPARVIKHSVKWNRKLL